LRGYKTGELSSKIIDSEWDFPKPVK